MSEEKKLYSLNEVIDDEIKLINDRRKRVRKRLQVTGSNSNLNSTKSTLVGLALSGGGIRSAVSNLGLLQGLSKTGILQIVDILSVVSGGGYIGACLASLLSKNPCGDKKNTNFSTAWERFPFRDDHLREPDNSCGDVFTSQDQVRHLRNWASYLVPRSTRLGSHEIKAAGSVSATVLIHLFWYISMMACLTFIYMGLVTWINPDFFWGKLEGMALGAGEKLSKIQEAAKIIWASAKEPFSALPDVMHTGFGINLFFFGFFSGIYLTVFRWFFF